MPRKKIITAMLVFAVLIIGAVVAIPLIIDSQKSATLNLFIVPTDAKITVDGKEFKNGNYRLNPGSVTVSIEKDGFESKSLSVNLEPNKTTLVYLPLFCADSSLTCYLDDKENLEILPYVASYSDRASEVQEFTKKSSITKILPISYEAYEDDYSKHFWITIILDEDLTTDKNFVLTATDFTGISQPLVKQILKESGFNPSDYTINYKSGNNPLYSGYSRSNE